MPNQVSAWHIPGCVEWPPHLQVNHLLCTTLWHHSVIYDTEKELEIYFDADLKKEDIVGCHPNDNTATVFLKFEDLVKYVKSCGHTISYIKV